MKRNGFTWVEAVVCLGILLLLAALLFPILSRGKTHGVSRQGRCRSFIMQIGLGILQYTQDYESLPKSNQPSNFSYSGPGNPPPASHWVTNVYPYIKGNTFQCLAEPNQSNTGTDYYLNSRVSGLPALVLRNPDSTVLITEGLEVTDGSKAVAAGPITTGSDPPPYARHLDTSNYLFLDGHVKAYPTKHAPGTRRVNNKTPSFAP